jgi:hypothetical protein
MKSIIKVSATLGPTVRQVIHEYLLDKLEAMEDGGAPVWTRVYPTELDGADNMVTPCVGIDYGEEVRLDSYGGCSIYELPVFFPFRFTPQYGVDEQALFQYYLGLLQHHILSDYNLSKNAQSIEDVGNVHSIVGLEGVYPGGTWLTKVIYKTRLRQPHKLI